MKFLYTSPLSEAAQTDERDDLTAVLSELGALDGDAIVEALSSEAGELHLEGQYRYGEYYSQLLAEELEELSNSSLTNLPLFSRDRQLSNVGFYEIDSATTEPAHANAAVVRTWALDLTRVGTRKTHWQAIETAVSQPDPGHSFGNGTEALVGIPAAAEKVLAVDDVPQPSERIVPDPLERRHAEFGAVDVYDADALALENPIFLYDIEHEQGGRVDPVVWDARSDYGTNDFGDGPYGGTRKFDADGIRRWQHVFGPDHEFYTFPILDNGLLRVWLDEVVGEFAAEEWDATGKEWTAVELPDSTWSLRDVDLTSITMLSVEAQLEFEDNDGSLYAVDVVLPRGYDELQVWIPESVSDPIPEGLSELLEPIASESVTDAGAHQTLIAREDARR